MPEALEIKREHALEIEKAIEERKVKREREEKAAEEYAKRQEERSQAWSALEASRASSALTEANGVRKIKPGARVMCRKCGGLMEIYNDNTCVMCGSKLLPD